jgi:hypothetical protein
MKCTDSFRISKLLGLLQFVIVSQLIKPFPFPSLWGGSVFVDFIYSHYLLSCIKRTLILTFRIINIYSKHPSLVTTDANPDGKGSEKESDKHIYCKKFHFCFYCLYGLEHLTANANVATVQHSPTQLKLRGGIGSIVEN